MKKRAKVHLLPTDKESHITFDKESSSCYSYGLHYLDNASGSSNRTKTERQHLYITTDDEIKEDDWCLFFWDGMKDGELGQVGSEPQQYLPSEGHTLNRNLRKIIATTDTKLHSTRLKACPINPEDNMVSVGGVSKPSKEFIEEYCKVGGIDEVDVEYGLFHDGNFKHGFETHAFKSIRKPRVNSNNEIIIHPIKDSWTREEVLKIIKDFAYCLYEKHGHPDPADTAIWIKENL